MTVYMEMGYYPVICFVRDRISLCTSVCPGIPYVDQAGLELSEIHQRLKAYTTNAWQVNVVLNK